MKKRKPAKPQLPPYVMLQDGKWHVRRSFPTAKTDAAGNKVYDQYKQRCFPETAEQAKAISDGMEAVFREALIARDRTPTLCEYLEQYNHAKKASVSRRYHEILEDTYERYIKQDIIAAVAVSDIKALLIQELYSRLQDIGTSPTMTKKVHEYLAGAFNQAVKWDVITKSPMSGVLVPKVAKTEAVWFDADEARAFLGECRRDIRNFVLEFALETGMRPGEYLALTWKDIKGDHVYVRRSLAVNYRDGSWEIKELKTRSSRRTIALSPEMAERLAMHRAAQSDEISRLESVIDSPPPRSYPQRTGVRKKKRSRHKKLSAETIAAFRHYNLVFPAANGVPMTRMNLTKWKFKPVCEAAGLDKTKYSLYTLRHTMATLSLSAGANIKAVAEKLGHAGTDLLLETYAHVLPSMRDETTEKLRAVLYETRKAA